MKTNIPTQGHSDLHTFWHSETKKIPKLVKLAMKSWELQGHTINVWTLCEVYDFGVKVNTIDLTSLCDDIPYDMMYCQEKPLGQDGRTITGFVDWCRFKIMSLMEDGVKIIDTDVILLKPYTLKGTTFVCEETFRVGNKLDGLYPCAGIITTTNTHIGSWLLDKANDKIHDGMKHGTLMNLVYRYCVNFIKSDRPFEECLGYVYDLDIGENILGNKEFFELGYDELDVFYENVSKSTIRRLKDVIGIHCWMGVLDQDRAFKKGTLLDMLWSLIMYNGCKPNYEILKLPQTEI